MIGIKDYEFKGFDWTELAEYFRIPVDYTLGDSGTLDSLRLVLRELQNTATGSEVDYIDGSDEDVINIRKYIAKMILDPEVGETKYLWIGLNKIEHDWTFLRYVNLLLEHMWT